MLCTETCWPTPHSTSCCSPMIATSPTPHGARVARGVAALFIPLPIGASRVAGPAASGASTTGRFSIERWYYRALKERSDPVARLRRKLRSHAGQQPAMSDAVRQAVLAQYAAHKGWSAKLHHQMGLVMNIVLGIIGAAVASWLFGFLGISLGGWIGYLIAGFIGACILIALARAFSGGLRRT